MEEEADFRELTLPEKAVIQRLLEADFAGRFEVQGQLSNVRVRRVDREGSLELRPADNSVPAPVAKRIPVEAEGLDEDGMCVHVLLHVVNGFVRELEVYKDDGSLINQMPSPENFKLLVLPA